MKINILKNAEYIIKILERAGYEAYVVGGCVRDSILGRIPNDWDITTSAKPLEVKALFSHTIDTGLQHGTVTVLYGKEGFEVTTYRIDGEYEDSRHPKEVTFTNMLSEDLQRRDFTINAMAYNHREGLIDLFGGLDDIRKKQIRCVGEADERFSEDALRILRAVRFSAQLGYSIEENTQKAMEKLAPTLKNISAERIQTELTKLLVSDNPDYLKNAWECGITKVILPEFDACMSQGQNHPHHCYSVGEHILHSMKNSPPDKVLRYAMLLHDIGKPLTHTVGTDGTDHFYSHPKESKKLAHEIFGRLKMDNDTRDKAELLILNHDRNIELNHRAVRRALNQLGRDMFELLLLVKHADILAQSDYLREEKLENLEVLSKLEKEIIENNNCYSIKMLAIGGNDLIKAGYRSGKQMGTVLNRLLETVLEDPSENTREKLLERAGKLFAEIEDHDRKN